jgi:type IV secretory pathway VirB10-like protein
MSLINDALKRAKQAQQQGSPETPKVQFRPVEAAQQPVKKNHTAIWIAVVIMAGLIIGFVFRQLTRENKNSNPKEVKAREIDPATSIAKETAPVAPGPAVPDGSASAHADTPSEAKPAAKLQAIVFDPRRPSAIISGKSVFVGDKIGDLRVVAITQESVTLVGGGQTNLLVLGE